jgi:WD40 repeat protein
MEASDEPAGGNKKRQHGDADLTPCADLSKRARATNASASAADHAASNLESAQFAASAAPATMANSGIWISNGTAGSNIVDALCIDVSSGRTLSESDMVSLIDRLLVNLGLADTAQHLSKESIASLELRRTTQLRRLILDGSWEGARAALVSTFPNSNSDWRILLALAEFQYLEALSRADKTAAILLLRTELRQLLDPRITDLGARAVSSSSASSQSSVNRVHHNPHDRTNAYRSRLHRLASLLVFAGQPGKILLFINDARSNIDMWTTFEGDSEHGRAQLWNRIQLLVSSSRHSDQSSAFDSSESASSGCSLSSAIECKPESELADGSLSESETPFACQCTQVLAGHASEIWAVQFSHAGSRFASASKDGVAMIWSIENGRVAAVPTLQLCGHSIPLSSLSWSGDDSLLLTAGDGSDVCVWDTSTGVLARTIKIASASVLRAVFLCLPSWDGGEAKPAQFWIVTTTVERELTVWNDHGAAVASLARIYDFVTDFAISNGFARDGVASCSTIAKKTIPRTVCSCSLCLTRNADPRLMMASTVSGSHGSSSSASPQRKSDSDTDVLAWRVIACTAGNELQLLEISHSQLSSAWSISKLQVLVQNTEITSVSLSPDGRFALVNTPSPNEVQLWDLGDPKSNSSECPARCIQCYSMAHARVGKSRLIIQSTLSSKHSECGAERKNASRSANGAIVFCGGEGVEEDLYLACKCIFGFYRAKHHCDIDGRGRFVYL